MKLGFIINGTVEYIRSMPDAAGGVFLQKPYSATDNTIEYRLKNKESSSYSVVVNNLQQTLCDEEMYAILMSNPLVIDISNQPEVQVGWLYSNDLFSQE